MDKTPYAVERFEQTYICPTTKAIRWISSKNVLPADCCDDLVEAGLIDWETRIISGVVRQKETTEALEKYIEYQRNMPEEAKAEQMAEMRAAFGPGEKVVNILTGETYEL